MLPAALLVLALARQEAASPAADLARELLAALGSRAAEAQKPFDPPTPTASARRGS